MVNHVHDQILASGSVPMFDTQVRWVVYRDHITDVTHMNGKYFVITVLVALVTITSASAGNWPAWRGPSASGIAEPGVDQAAIRRPLIYDELDAVAGPGNERDLHVGACDRRHPLEQPGIARRPRLQFKAARLDEERHRSVKI